MQENPVQVLELSLPFRQCGTRMLRVKLRAARKSVTSAQDKLKVNIHESAVSNAMTDIEEEMHPQKVREFTSRTDSLYKDALEEH